MGTSRRAGGLSPLRILSATTTLSLSLFLAVGALGAAPQLPDPEPQDFLPAETVAAAAANYFAKRQGCIADTYSCAGMGSSFNNICCANGQTCALDADNNPACCPSGAVCTGTAPATFVPPSTATTTAPVSYVANALFPFPYAPTSFANSASCSSAVSQCGADYASCTAWLEGGNNNNGGFGVTVVVPGSGGTTVVGGGTLATTTLASASATSVCSSLSSAACGGLQYSLCTMTGSSPSGFYIGTGNAAAPARPTAACLGMVGAVAGLGIWNGL